MPEASLARTQPWRHPAGAAPRTRARKNRVGLEIKPTKKRRDAKSHPAFFTLVMPVRLEADPSTEFDHARRALSERSGTKSVLEREAICLRRIGHRSDGSIQNTTQQVVRPIVGRVVEEVEEPNQRFDSETLPMTNRPEGITQRHIEREQRAVPHLTPRSCGDLQVRISRRSTRRRVERRSDGAKRRQLLLGK